MTLETFICFGFYAIVFLMVVIITVEIAHRWWFPEPIRDPAEDEYPEPKPQPLPAGHQARMLQHEANGGTV